MSIHSIKRSQCHLAWDKTIPPVLHVTSGETITFSCLDASNGQVKPTTLAASLSTLSTTTLDQVNGPIHVLDAHAGDTLQVEVLDVAPAEDWGWTALIPGFGLLADEFPEPVLKIWDLRGWKGGEGKNVDAAGIYGEGKDAGGYAWFDEKKGVRIPLRPFAGEMGVAPVAPGPHSTIPPYRTGGNVDTKHLSKGATLYLPVEVEGALFSIGDGHGAQGDGEVCGTAIEMPMTVTVRLTVLKDRPHITMPHFSTPRNYDDPKGYYCTTGVGPDIREATREAVRQMITSLSVEHGLSREEAYMLCSVAGDLRMHEVVDMPNFVIGMMIPRSIFGHTSLLA